MKPRRSSKEPALAPGSPFAPIVEQLKSMARGLAATQTASSDPDESGFVSGKIQGLESAITLMQRAGAPGVVTPEGQHLVQITRQADPLEARVAELEKQVRGLLTWHATSPPRARALPEVLATPAPREKGDGKLGRCERALLTVLVQRRGQITNARQLAILSGYSLRSSGFQNALSRLRKLGVAQGRPDNLTATSEGLRTMEDVPKLPTGPELVAHWMQALGKTERALLHVLTRHYPEGIFKDDLARTAGYSITSSGFQNAVSKLRTLQLVDPGWPARAAAVFFENTEKASS